MKTKTNRKEVINALKKIMSAKPEDAVKIAFLGTENESTDIDKCDFTLVQEIKRSPQGAVEVKLIDRIAVIDRLIELTKEEDGGGGLEGLMGAISSASSSGWSDEP